MVVRVWLVSWNIQLLIGYVAKDCLPCGMAVQALTIRNMPSVILHEVRLSLRDYLSFPTIRAVRNSYDLVSHWSSSSLQRQLS